MHDVVIRLRGPTAHLNAQIDQKAETLFTGLTEREQL